MQGTSSNDMCDKRNVPSIFKKFFCMDSLVSNEVNNRELQVDLMCSSLLFLIFLWTPVFFHGGCNGRLYYVIYKFPIHKLLMGWILVWYDVYRFVLTPHFKFFFFFTYFHNLLCKFHTVCYWEKVILVAYSSQTQKSSNLILLLALLKRFCDKAW